MNRRTQPKGVRLADVARSVGVSSSEVSRVLNGRMRDGKSVAQETRDRILAAARELNYMPHRAAQNLAVGRTDVVALMLLLDDRRELYPHYHEIIGALTYTLNGYGIHLLLAQYGPDPLESLEHMARSRTCDGMIITDMKVDDERPALLDRIGTPFVVRGSSPRAGVVAVGMDNAQVGYRAMSYLFSLGHRAIAFYNIGRDYMSGQRRFEGFCQARDEYGLQATAEYYDSHHQEEGMYQAVRGRFSQPNPPTAIFAEDELGAFGALRALSDIGLRCPEDVSVMTCLNARFMRLVNPHLTVLNVRQDEVAAEAGHLLARLLRGEDVEKRQLYLQPHLEERGSARPPRKHSL